MTPNPFREAFVLSNLAILGASILVAACTAPNPDFRPLGLVVSNVMTKQGSDLVFVVRVDVQDVPVSVEYEAVDDTAVRGREYVETKGMLTLEQGSSTASIVVPTLLYNHVPGDVILKLNVTVSRRTVSETQTGTGTITPIAELAHFSSIAAGRFHSCGVTPQGTVKCWGVNDAGQLGNNSTRNALAPVDAVGPTNVTTISAGGEHTCAVTAQGAVKCWGRNSFGQLGNNSTTGSLVPADVVNLSGITAVTAGGAHTCALKGDGKVKCWGANDSGQLGNNSTAASQLPVEVKRFDFASHDFASLTGVTSIAAGLGHTCAVSVQGKVLCWGENRSGQLGDNSTSEPRVALEVYGASGGITAVSTGTSHTCALGAQGTVTCWGGNSFGQLGNNSTVTALAPVNVPGLTGVSAIAAGGGQTLALTRDHTLKGWGAGSSLGSNVTTSSVVPIELAGFTNVTTIVEAARGLGPGSTCAITEQKGVTCTSSADLLTGADVSSFSGATAIAVGYGYTCAVTPQGTVRCVGRNADGQLGNNSTTDAEVPVEVVGLSSVTSISAGGSYTCALTSEGRVKCWGLGYGGKIVDVGLTSVSSIEAGLLETYAVTAQGTVKRWSPNGVPVDVAGLGGVTSITAGFGHNCALTSQGTVQCWGTNHNGQLGNNSTVDSAVPVAVAGLTGVTKISAGHNHTCAVTSQGTAMCWGGTTYPAAGSVSLTTIPSEALGGQQVLGIVAGFLSTSFITSHGTVRQVGFLTFNSHVPIDTVYMLK
jgi:alpha-tubulin suppressor-like RCC1 family protein